MRLNKFAPSIVLPFFLLAAAGCPGSDPDPLPPPPPPPPPGCTAITVDGIALARTQEGYTSYEGAPNPGVDGAAPDFFSLQFYQLEGFVTDGTVDLTAGANANYATCTECALVYGDIDQENQTTGKIYYQSAGSLTLTADPYKLNLQGTITGLKLIEVTINEETFESTAVAGGGCIEVSGTFTMDYAGWSCDYDTTFGTDDPNGEPPVDGACDCECGEVTDPDCAQFSPTVNGCEAAETCGGGGTCIAACDIYTPTACTTGTCVSRNALVQFGGVGSPVDYCESNGDLIDTAAIGVICADQDSTFFCGVDAGIAKGICALNGADYMCEKACRIGGTDCAGNETCTPLDTDAPTGTCRPTPI